MIFRLINKMELNYQYFKLQTHGFFGNKQMSNVSFNKNITVFIAVFSLNKMVWAVNTCA